MRQRERELQSVISGQARADYCAWRAKIVAARDSRVVS